MSDEITSDKHPVLYHYTTFAGFKGIMSSQTLFARHFKSLNDTTEVIHSRLKLSAALLPRIKKEIKKHRGGLKQAIREFGGIHGLALNEANAVLNSLFETAFGTDERPALFPLYVTSFCSHIDDDSGYAKANGLLSMWRGYANGGVAVVFDTRELEKCLGKEFEEFYYSFGSLGDVVYEGDDAFFQEEFGDFVEMFKDRAITMLTDNEHFHLGEGFIQGFFQTASRYKHQAFAEEREVRIVCAPWGETEYASELEENRMLRKWKERIDREGIEYIDLFDGEAVPKLPIMKVIIGPHREQKARYDEARELLRHRKEIEVTCSATPYLEL